MDDLRIGERVEYRGRQYRVLGFLPMSVQPPRATLEHVMSLEVVEAPFAELERQPPTAPGEAARQAARDP